MEAPSPACRALSPTSYSARMAMCVPWYLPAALPKSPSSYSSPTYFVGKGVPMRDSVVRTECSNRSRSGPPSSYADDGEKDIDEPDIPVCNCVQYGKHRSLLLGNAIRECWVRHHFVECLRIIHGQFPQGSQGDSVHILLAEVLHPVQRQGRPREVAVPYPNGFQECNSVELAIVVDPILNPIQPDDG